MPDPELLPLKLIIGIGGLSRAGKSSLAEYLKWLLGTRGIASTIVSQDSFVNDESQIPKVRGFTDWESPQSIKFSSFGEAITGSTTNNPVVIAEGILCFYNPEVNSLFDKRFFIEISQTAYLHRKKIDRRWGEEPDWYIDHIWDAYIKYGRKGLDQHTSNYLWVDGERPFSPQKIWKYLTHS